MENFIDYKKLQKLSESDKNVPLYKKIIKLQEECGEVAQEFLAWDDKQNGIKTNSSKSAQGTIEAVIEEVCDVTNVCIDILNFIEMKYPGKSEYIAKRFQEKLDKWETKIEANKFISEYKEAYNEMSAKQLAESMKNIGYIETMNGNINFK
jgi:NTP pyrophosphatase (non-canonical NTP hydrolase)